MKLTRNLVAAVLVAGGSLAALAAGSTLAAAQDTSSAAATAPPGPHRDHGWGPGHMYGKLGLTAEQQASIKAIFTAAKPQMQSLHQQMRANHLKLQGVTPDDPNYASVVAEVAAANASLASQATSQRAELRAQAYAVLTPAQKTQLASLEAQWAANPHKGHWGGPGPAAPPAP
jgi:Spy/CpxP family protein refolding chaperone